MRWMSDSKGPRFNSRYEMTDLQLASFWDDVFLSVGIKLEFVFASPRLRGWLPTG